MKMYIGKIASDTRGSVTFFNSFKFLKVKRFYQVVNSAKEPIRAFHGHTKEEKYVTVVEGKILLCLVKLTNTKEPSKKVKVKKIVLSTEKPQIIHVPAGYANGFKSLAKNSKVIFFSTSSLKESQKDDYRFPYDYWGKDIWK